MENLDGKLYDIVCTETIEIMFHREALEAKIRNFSLEGKSVKEIFQKCVDSRFFFHALYLENINEVLFEGYKMKSDFISSGGPPTYANSVVDSFIAVAERLREIDILSKFDESRTDIYESLAEAIRSYEKGQYKRALTLLSQPSTSNFDMSYYWFGKYYYDGKATEKNTEKAIPYFMKGVQAGSTDSMYQMALCYLKGDGVDKAPEKGMEFLLKAAEEGQEDAVFAAGYMYKDGTGGVARDIKKAIDFLQKSADYGNWSAAIAVCDLYFEDAKTTGNFHRTAVAKKRVQDVKDPEICYKIALIYERGLGVPQNIEKALNFSARAATKNYPGAKEMMVRLSNLRLGR